MAGPHLIIDVLVPNARVNNSVALHAAGDFVQNVALTCILGEIVAKLILEDFEKDDLFLLHGFDFEFQCLLRRSIFDLRL